jgi:formamidopyrimidine-DNA glycosylase
VPELPEVEIVRRGLAGSVVGATVGAARVLHPRAARRHPAGGDDLAAALTGATVLGAHRRGKYLWLPVTGGMSLVAHLGMSGQLLVLPADTPAGPHLRAVLDLSGGPVAADGPPSQLRYVDQRTFGGLFLAAGGPDESALPRELAHIAPDPLGELSAAQLWTGLHRRRTGIKRALLSQTTVSGVGNIYADEALWLARLHGDRSTATLTRAEVARLLDALRSVMGAALDLGGTSFDRLYVDVNGASGRYSTSLAVYGQQGRPCPRCGTLIVREPFMNRSSHRCPRCQPAPRRPARRPPVRGSSATVR